MGRGKCVHLGPPCGKESDELACCTDDMVTVYECSLHRKCTIGPWRNGTHPYPICCLCEDWKEKDGNFILSEENW